MPKINIRRKAQLGLDIQYGGRAIPIARNMVYFDGNSHAAGGIGVGNNLEVEGGEVGEKKGGILRIFSAVPFLGGMSPAQLVMGGANPNKVFKAQEDFKDNNRIKDDGTHYQVGGNKIINYENLPNSFKGKRVNGRILQGGVPPIVSRGELAMGNPIQRMSMWNDDLGEFSKFIAKSFYKYIPKKLDKPYRYIVDYFSMKGPNNAIDNNAENLAKAISLFNAHEYKTGGIYIKPSKRGTFTVAAKKRGMGVQQFASKVLANKEDYSPAMVKKANFARNASRRKKEYGGDYEPKRNEKGQVVLDPNNPDDIKWLHEQQGKRGAKAVHKGQQEFLKGALDRTTPIMLGVAAANPITTTTSLAGGYLLGEVGELGGKLYKGLTGEDYTREGKVIGQTIGGLFGPVGAKLFGKGATNAWNTYKSNRLNSTQTLIDVPEEGLVIREPIAAKTSPKQIEQINTQKYLPTEVEDLTWREPKALLETQAQVTRRDLKNFNRWAKLFGYEPVPLRYAETKSIADRHVQDRIKQHNTFLRGVAKPNKLQKQAIEYELAKEGITNPTDYDVYTYMATHSTPSTGAGRADLRPIQVRKRKVDNFNLSKTSDSPIGALYTQGSGRGAAGYAGMGPESGGNRRTGVVVEVARPTNFRPEASYAEWVKENDFNFGDIRSKGFHEKVANRIVETGKAPEGYNLSNEDKQILFNEIKNEFAARPEPVYKTSKFALDYIKNNKPNIVKNITQFDESAFNSLSNDSKRAYIEYLGKLMIGVNPKKISFSNEVKKENNKFKKIYKDAIIRETKNHQNKYLRNIDYNPEDYTQPDFSVLKSTTRNRGNAQQHYIFRAPIGEKVLEGRGFYLPTEEEIINATTDHYSLWTHGYSRNTRKFGGIKKFKFGGSMIYEINGNVKNGLISARPKAQYGKDTLIRNNTKWVYDEKSGAYVPVGKTTQYKTVAGKIFKKEVGDNKWVETKEKPITNKQNIKNNEPKKLVNTNDTNKVAKNKITYDKEYWRDNSIGLNNLEEDYMTGKRRSSNRHPIPDFIGEVNKGKEVINVKTNSEPRRKYVNKVNAVTKSNKPVTNKVNTKVNNKYSTPLAENKESLYITGIKNNTSSPIRTEMEKIKSSSPTGGQVQSSSDGRWIGQYKPVTTADWIGLGSNVAGAIASYLLTRKGIDKMPKPVKPIMAQAAKLKTKYNINAPLSEISQGTQLLRALIRRNTQSSNTSLVREQRAINEAQQNKNKLYTQKENNETQLINQDRLNRQNVMMNNVRTYNDYLNRLTAIRQGQNELKVSNINNLLSGLTGSVNNILGTIESRRATNNTIRAIAAANPNVDARLIGGFDYYIDPITKRKYNKNQQYIGTINS